MVGSGPPLLMFSPGAFNARLDYWTCPAREPVDLMRLAVPALVISGHDDSHATSAARYLEECLLAADYWDVPVSDQTEPAVAARILKFLESVAAPA